MSLDDSVESLKQRLQHLEADLAQKNKIIQDLNRKVQEASDSAQPTAELSELEDTLRRMMTRIAMILQGSKCLFLIHDTETHELYAGKPAIGFDDIDLSELRVPESDGLSGQCFSREEPTFLYDVDTDLLAPQETFAEINVRNGLAFPLTVEKRDEETNKVLERRTVGVLWVFNKKFGGIFSDEDVFLLKKLASNTAAVINTAATFEKVVAKKEELEETITALTAGLLMIAKNGRLLQMNPSARHIFGIRDDEPLAGRTYLQIIPNEEMREILSRALSEEGGVNQEIEIAEPDDIKNIHTFQVQSALVKNDASDTVGTAVILNDITRLKGVDKMKTAFVSTVSHELRTPLTSIKGFIQTLLYDEDGTMYDDAMRLEFYNIINNECDRLKRLIDDLLNVSRIDDEKGVEMNINDVSLRDTLKKVITIQEGSTYKRPTHALSWSLADDVPAIIQADQDKLEQIFHNLIGNSLKYSPDGGPVTVHGKMMPGGELMEFAIADKGIGMSEEFLGQAGERFARADNRDTRTIGGTGIGLFLVKNFIEAHGGRMWPHSEGLGKGSTFFFTLPITQPDDMDGTDLSARVAG